MLKLVRAYDHDSPGNALSRHYDALVMHGLGDDPASFGGIRWAANPGRQAAGAGW